MERLLRTRLFLLACLLLPACAASAQATHDLIFQPGSVSFAASHASTIVELKSGGLMAAWFGGTAESRPDVAIWGSQMHNGTWSAPVELAREAPVPCWNPVLFYTTDGRLWLYYKFGPSPGTWTAARRFSTDEGKTWSPPEHLPAGLVGPVRTKPLVLPDGTIVSGSSTESYHSWAAWIERSIDNGNTWARIGPLVPPPSDPDSSEREGIIQPSIVSLGGEHLRFYARSTESIGKVVVADSYDAGMSWSQPRPIDVPNPNSGIDAVALKDGRVVLVYNNTTHGRSPLNLGISSDGEHFTMFSTLEDQPGEFSYPAMIETANGDLLITYTWNRKTIRFVRIHPSEISKRP